MPSTRTPKKQLTEHQRRCAKVKQDLQRRGVCFSQLAEQYGVSRSTLYMALNGRRPGLRGDSHRVAVLLGIKDGEINEGGNA